MEAFAMTSVTDVEHLLKSKGLTMKSVSQSVCKVYISRDFVGDDPHAAFSLSIGNGITRQEAKFICFWFLFKNKFMRYMFKSGQSLGLDQAIKSDSSRLISLHKRAEKEHDELFDFIFKNKQ
ncbi:MAG: hypothetical protein ACRDC4_17625 [Plesiomonas sp.]